MPPPTDWTPGPAKWLAVLALGGATIAGLAYSITRGSTPWRAEPASVRLAQPVEGEPSPPPARRTATKAPGLKINLNSAPKPELELLPGVGPALADRIIAERSHGPFSRIEDLGRVRGIGPKIIEKLREHATVE